MKSTIFVLASIFIASAYSGAIGVAPVAVPVSVAVPADIVSYPAYKTSYAVSDAVTGDHKSAFEERDGDVTRGSYQVLQPDGVLRIVNYISTPLTGFKAEVINKGTGVHPGTLAKAIIGVAAPLAAINAPVAPIVAPAVVPVRVAKAVVAPAVVPIRVAKAVVAPAVAVPVAKAIVAHGPAPVTHNAPAVLSPRESRRASRAAKTVG